jgi:hypothetical protein
MKFWYLLFNKIHLFYTEVVVTTNCSLKCKECYEYVPYLDKVHQRFMSFENYKIYIDNLLSNIDSLKYLRFLGGEALLSKDLDKFLQYALEQKKIKKVSLVTNGTIELSDEIINVLSKYPKKAMVDISNYSSNEKLRPRLKEKAIIKKCNENNINVIYLDTLEWIDISKVKYHNRSIKNNEKYYLSCASVCVGIHEWNKEAGEICAGVFPCIKAGIFKLCDIGNQKESIDYISLSKPVSKKDFIKFYFNNNFDACQYCSYLEDRKKRISPAEQIEDGMNVENKLYMEKNNK